jgi:pimeloyl-ACP methyl ester carboxylesterase
MNTTSVILMSILTCTFGLGRALQVAQHEWPSSPTATHPRMHSALAKTQPLDNLAPLAKADVPILHVCGSLDPWFKDNTLEVEKRYKRLGGKIQVIVKHGEGHYPLAPQDPAPVVDFITQAAM